MSEKKRLRLKDIKNLSHEELKKDYPQIAESIEQLFWGPNMFMDLMNRLNKEFAQLTPSHPKGFSSPDYLNYLKYFLIDMTGVTSEQFDEYDIVELKEKIKKIFKNKDIINKCKQGAIKGRINKFGPLQEDDLFKAIQEYINQLIEKNPLISCNQIYRSIGYKFNRKPDTIKKYKLTGKIKIERPED